MDAAPRNFPRAEVDINVAYEFVKWNETNNKILHKPDFTEAYDLSVNGIGLINHEKIKHSVLKDLHSGKLKFRIGIYLNPSNEPLITFARLIWSNDEEFTSRSKFGLTFIDVSEDFFEQISNYLESIK